MRIILHCVLILAFAILVKNVYYLSSLLKPSREEVRSYILALQWPPGVCSEPGVKCKIERVPTEFTIHGLWPEPNGTRPDKPFNESELDPITTELNESWPNLKSRNYTKFWKHEWEKHGRFSRMEELDYFKKTLALFKDDGQGLKEELAKENITPSNTYKLDDILDALSKINRKNCTVVICNKRNSSKETQIKEIRFNYTKNFTKQDTLNSSINCGDKILFPDLTGLTEVVSMTEVHLHPL